MEGGRRAGGGCMALTKAGGQLPTTALWGKATEMRASSRVVPMLAGVCTALGRISQEERESPGDAHTVGRHPVPHG